MKLLLRTNRVVFDSMNVFLQ